MAAGEFDYIQWIRKQVACHPRVRIGPGDDCAAVEPPRTSLLITTDVLTEGVDFFLHEAGGYAVGRKAMAVNISDIAAMAGVPLATVVGLVLPRGSGDLANELFHGMKGVADRFDVSVVGGDTNAWSGGLVVSVTVLGAATDRGPVTRAGARPGDWVFVTGPVGGSILGRHLDPTPRVREALALHAAADLHAMIDVSDGLAADLNHLLEESGCGAVLSADAIPIHPDAVALSRQTHRAPLDHALSDGEDFELVFTVSADDGTRLLRTSPVPGVTKIGECVDSGLWIEDGGERRPLPPTGWVHNV